MDFRRIEWIFLMVFVGLNIFLGVIFFQSRQVAPTATVANGNTVISDIKADNIQLPKLDKKQTSGGYLASSPQKADWTTARKQLKGLTVSVSNTVGVRELTAHLKVPYALKTGEEIKMLTEWVKDPNNVLHGERYRYIGKLSDEGHYVFMQTIDGATLFDTAAQLTVRVDNHLVTDYTQQYLSNVQVLRKDLTLGSEQQAVGVLYRSNELPANTRVLWTHLAYTKLLTTKGSTVYVPAWFIGLESSNGKNVTIKRVNALTQTVMKTKESS